MKKILATVFIASTSFLMNNEKDNLLPNLTLIQRIKNYSGNESWKGLVWSTGFSGIAGLTFLGIKRQLPQPKTIKTFSQTMPKTQKLITGELVGLTYILPQLYNWSTYTKITKAKNIEDIIKFLNKTDKRALDHQPSKKYFYQPNPLKILAQRLDEESLKNKMIVDDIVTILSTEDIKELIKFLSYNSKNTKEILKSLEESINTKIKSLSNETTIDEWILLFQLINKDTRNYDNNINEMIVKINNDEIIIPSKQLAEHETVNSTELYHLPRTIHKVISGLNKKKAEHVDEKSLVAHGHQKQEKTFSDFLFDLVVNRLNKGREYWHLNNAVYVFSCFDKTNIEKNTKSLNEGISNFKNESKRMMFTDLYKDFSDKNNQLLTLYWFNLNFLQKSFKVSQYKNNYYKELINIFMKIQDDDKYKEEKAVFLNTNKANIKKEIDNDTLLKNHLKKECSYFNNFYRLISN